MKIQIRNSITREMNDLIKNDVTKFIHKNIQERLSHDIMNKFDKNIEKTDTATHINHELILHIFTDDEMKLIRGSLMVLYMLLLSDKKCVEHIENILSIIHKSK